MATTHDKKKKGSFMNFYKSGTVAGDPFTAAPNYRPYSFPMTPPPTSNRPHSWLPKKKPTRNIFPDIKRVDDKSVVARKSSAVGQSQTPVEARRSFSHAAVVVEGRRSSVSSQVETNVAAAAAFLHVEAAAAFLHVEARRSFSHAEAKLAAEGRPAAVVEGRRSVSSQVETNVAAVAAVLNVKVLVADMAGFMQVHAFRCARKSYDGLDKFSSKQMALTLKKEFDEVYGPAWHCIVGSSFGSFVTHGTGCFLYFSMDKLYILLFKTKVKRAS